MSQPRRHHFIPQIYLAGFTSDGTKDGQLYAIDLMKKKKWRCKPNGVANVRDFYRVDIPGQDPFVVERGLAEIEGIIATVLREILETGKLPSGDNMDVLLHLVALSASKVPAVRERLGKPVVEVTERVMALTLANPDRYYSTLKSMKESGIDVSAYPSYDEMKRTYDNNGFVVTPSQNWNVSSALMMADSLLPILKARNWGLVVAEKSSDIFVCNDNPVLLTWTKEDLTGQPLGYGLKNTMVYMPLSSSMGLMGLFTPVQPIMRFDSLGIASLNSEMILSAYEQVYSRNEFFNILWEDYSLRVFPPEDIYGKC